MRANEFLGEGLRDWIGKNVYKLTGVDNQYGGRKGAATRDRFIGNFVSYFNNVKKSSDQSGMPLDVKRMVNAYLAKNKWTVYDTSHITAIRQAIDDITKSNYSGSAIKKLANMMYVVGMEQNRDKYGQPEQTPDQLSTPADTTPATASTTEPAAPAATAPSTDDALAQQRIQKQKQAQQYADQTATTTKPTVAPKTPEQIRQEKQAKAVSNANREMAAPPKGTVLKAGKEQYKWMGAQWINTKTGRVAKRELARALNKKWTASPK